MFFKKVGQRTLYSAIVVLLALTLVTPALAAFVPGNYRAALRVLGQPNFLSNAPAATRAGMNRPTSVAVDPLTHKVFVADGQNNRVLRYASLYALANGAAAQAVFGQPNFTSNAAATTRKGMSIPYGVFVDAGGRLWVADFANNRVLRFDHASALASGANASAVLGQPGFTTNTQNTTRSGMNGPEAVLADAGGRLWVADSNNSRVLRFDAAATRPNGANAGGVLGQPNFTTNAVVTTRKGMAYPHGMAVDSTGRLWVADFGNDRVLRFNAAAGKANGANADGVLGEPNFTSVVIATTRSGMFDPSGVTVDLAGNLYVADLANTRILIYRSAAALANGANAAYVLGQTSFTTSTVNFGGLSAKSLDLAISVFYDPHAQVLFVADTYNNRVLMYGTPNP